MICWCDNDGDYDDTNILDVQHAELDLQSILTEATALM